MTRDVTGRRAVVARRLELLEKRADQRGVQVLDAQGARRGLYAVGGELEQRPEAVRVRVTRVETGATVAPQVLAEERFDVRGERGHGWPPPTQHSLAAATSVSNSGVASRYQYVDTMLTCPR